MQRLITKKCHIASTRHKSATNGFQNRHTQIGAMHTDLQGILQR